MAGTWPDGLPVDDLVLHFRLSCGHERNARGWRGEEGTSFHCSICKILATIEEISLTDEAPGRWHLNGVPVPSCEHCGAAPDSFMHRADCPRNYDRISRGVR
jgi:hypothetical protein